MAKANPFRKHVKRDTDPGNVKAVFRLQFGKKKYFIGKARGYHSGLEFISAEIDRRIRLGITPDHMLYKVVQYVKKGHVSYYEADIILADPDPVKLMVAEHKALKEAKDDPECLNNSFEVYVPQWITQAEVEEYKKEIAPAKKKAAPKKKKNVAPTKATKNNKAVSARRSGEGKGSVRNTGRTGVGVQHKKESASSVKEKPKGTVQRPKR